MWNTTNHKKTRKSKWQSYSLNEKGNGHTNGFSWNFTKVMLWIYLRGRNIVHGVLDIMFRNENFEKVSFN
jgi:hypothetical protein